MSGKLTITQVRSTVGQSKAHEGTLRALGLGKIGRSAEHTESPSLAGMLRHVKHLVKVEATSISGVRSTEPLSRRRLDGAGQGAKVSASPALQRDTSAGAGSAGAGAGEQ